MSVPAFSNVLMGGWIDFIRNYNNLLSVNHLMIGCVIDVILPMIFFLLIILIFKYTLLKISIFVATMTIRGAIKIFYSTSF